MRNSFALLLLTFLIGIEISTAYPTLIRLARDDSSSNPVSEAVSSSSTSSNYSVDAGLIEPTTTQRPQIRFSLLGNSNNGFGVGAAAGFGGLGASAGLGTFTVDPKSDPFLPFGAFAGINLPNSAGRIGAGCSGLNCGVQLGEFVLQVPNIVAIASNFSTRQQQRIGNSFSDAVGSSSSLNDTSSTTSSNSSPQGQVLSILRTRIDGATSSNSNTASSSTLTPNQLLEQGQNLIRALFGGVRDFRTTFAGFFREPGQATAAGTGTNTSTNGSDEQGSSSSDPAAPGNEGDETKNNSNNGPETTNNDIPKKAEVSDNEVISNSSADKN